MLKSQVFAGSAALPGDLQLQVGLTEGVDAGISGQMADVEALIAVLKERLVELDGSIEQASAGSVPDAVAELYAQKRALSVEWEAEQAEGRELVRARDLAWETYSTLQVKAVELGIATETADVEVVFASPAVEPLTAVGRSHLLTAIVAGACGLVAGVLLVLLLDFAYPDFDFGRGIVSLLRRSEARES